MHNDKFAGQGGSYVLDPKTNKRTRVEEPTTGYARTTKPGTEPVEEAATSAVAQPSSETDQKGKK